MVQATSRPPHTRRPITCRRSNVCSFPSRARETGRRSGGIARSVAQSPIEHPVDRTAEHVAAAVPVRVEDGIGETSRAFGEVDRCGEPEVVALGIEDDGAAAHVAADLIAVGSGDDDVRCPHRARLVNAHLIERHGISQVVGSAVADLYHVTPRGRAAVRQDDWLLRPDWPRDTPRWSAPVPPCGWRARPRPQTAGRPARPGHRPVHRRRGAVAGARREAGGSAS